MGRMPSLPSYLPVAGGRIIGFIPMLYEMQSHLGFELRSPHPFPMIVTITPQVSPIVWCNGN